MDQSYVFSGKVVESPLKRRVRRVVVGIGWLPLVRNFVHAHAVRDALHGKFGFRLFYSGVGYETAHPFDRAHGTETSGYVAASELPDSEHSSKENHFGYWGSQPSCVRSSLAHIPALETFRFVDLGCGKGRCLLVATEFPFRGIVGVELSDSMAELARRNAEIFARNFPERTRVQVDVADACTYRWPEGNLVIYLYNPFGEEVLAKVIASIERAVAEGSREIYVIYFYPLLAGLFDASPKLRRHVEDTAVYTAEERGFGLEGDGKYIIWRGN